MYFDHTAISKRYFPYVLDHVWSSPMSSLVLNLGSVLYKLIGNFLPPCLDASPELNSQYIIYFFSDYIQDKITFTKVCEYFLFPPPPQFDFHSVTNLAYWRLKLPCLGACDLTQHDMQLTPAFICSHSQKEFLAEKAELSARLNFHKWSRLSRNSPAHIFQKERGWIK